MCGIFGVLNNHNLLINKKNVKNSASLMKHRGPDAFDQWGIKNKIELAHLRLAIIDLNVESQQPFFSNFSFLFFLLVFCLLSLVSCFL